MEWEEPHLSGFTLDRNKTRNHYNKRQNANWLFTVFKAKATLCIHQAYKEKDLIKQEELYEKSHLYNYYSCRANRLVQMLDMRKERFYKN